jgi:hypothetical protein
MLKQGKQNREKGKAKAKLIAERLPRGSRPCSLMLLCQLEEAVPRAVHNPSSMIVRRLADPWLTLRIRHSCLPVSGKQTSCSLCLHFTLHRYFAIGRGRRRSACGMHWEGDVQAGT